MIRQIWGPLVDLMGDGGYRAWTIGAWLTMKYANLVSFLLIAVLFTAGMFLHVPERKPTQP